MSGHYLFCEAKIFDVMEQRQRQLRDAFARLDASALEDNNLSEHLAMEYGLDVPLLDEGKKYATTREVDVDVSQDHQRRIWDRSKPFLMRGTEITIHVPFQGDANLFRVKPATFNVNPPEGQVAQGELQFVYTIIEQRDVTPELERTIREVKQHLDWLRPSAGQLKSQLEQLTNSLLAERRQRTEAHVQSLAKLGIPIRQAEPRPAMPSPAAAADVSKGNKSKPRHTERNWDVFISHATEDKEAIARPLADALAGEGLKVWYDEFSLKLGDSLRESIDRGLARSRYGIVILSPHFFEKHWPQQELNGLTTREVAGIKVILPVWHNVGLDEVRAFSPTLADKLAVRTDSGLGNVVKSVLDAMK